MGIFRRNSTVSTTSSNESNNSTNKASIKVSELASSFSHSTASPNSRILFLPPSPTNKELPPLTRNISLNSTTSTHPSTPTDSNNVITNDSRTVDESTPSKVENNQVLRKPESESEESEDEGESLPTVTNVKPRTSSLGAITSIPAVIPQRTESPASIESESEEEEAEGDEFEEAEEEEEVEDYEESEEEDEYSLGPKRKLSTAAKLVVESMASPANTRSRKGKPLADLKYEDVHLTEADLKEDITVVWKAMHLFMSSRMIEAEEICLSAADHRLYYSVGFSLIQVIKSLATFEPNDIEAAIHCCKDSIIIAQLLRKKDYGLFETVGRLAKGSTSSASIKSMTLVERHAELIFAECTLLKAVLGVIYSGDFIAFLKEALNMRNAYAIYRTLAKFVEETDKAYSGEGEDPSIDNDFRSGVFLGNGLISLILSLLPSAVLKIMTVFGFTGDETYALTTLKKAGRWEVGKKEPGMKTEEEGIRRQVCDMALLTHFLVIASYLPVGGVDIPMASNILHFNLDRYPNGVFFLYFAGRLNATETQLSKSVVSYHKAIKSQLEFVQLAHICYWDLGLVSLAMGNYSKGYECFTILDKESNWSKAVYAYAKAVTLYEDGKDVQATSIMKNVPDLLQRIAGKSVPLEKFVARRSKKFIAQGNRLLLPGIELAYVLNCLGLSPRFALFEVHLDQISSVLVELHQVTDFKNYGTGKGDEYWDDYCLAHLFRAIVLRFIAHPAEHVKCDPPNSMIPIEEADQQAFISLNNVLKHSKDLVHDHHLAWFAHYEIARLYDARKEFDKAREHYSIVLSGKIPELVTVNKPKGKVSLQNMAVLRSNSALQLLEENFKST